MRGHNRDFINAFLLMCNGCKLKKKAVISKIKIQFLSKFIILMLIFNFKRRGRLRFANDYDGITRKNV